MSVTHVLCNKARCWMGVAWLVLAVGCSGPPSTLEPEPSCTDGLQNNDETDVDCGGSCSACTAGQACVLGTDCLSRICAGVICATAVCGDGVVNQAGEDCDIGIETATCDLDCTIAECGDGTLNPYAGEWCDHAGETAACDIDCTPAWCGDSVVNITAGETCDDGGASTTCDVDCTAVECGDGVVNRVAGETCDDGGESVVCDVDCTPAFCGDGQVNAVAGEDCDLGAANSDHGRCGSGCFWGAGLDGSFGAVWVTLSPPPGTAQGLVSFHYSDQFYIHDFALSHRYDAGADTWTPIPAPYPFGSSAWANAAVGPDAMWIPRDGAMYRFHPASQTWTVAATAIPDGSVTQSAAVFDGDGFVWYHGPGTDLVRYDPAMATAAVFAHPTAGTMAQTRFAYDPVTNSVVFTGFVDTEFTIFDIDSGAFSISSPNPGGYVQDNTCQDRSGNIYAGSTNLDAIYQYNVATDIWTLLGPLPFDHDFNSTCVVSQDGYLYYTASGQLARLPLGVR